MHKLITLRAELSQNNLDGMLIGSPANRRYLSGFTGSAGWLIITAHKACLAVDFRYVEQAEREAYQFESIYVKGDIITWLPTFIKELGIKRLGVESEHLSVSVYNSFSNAIKTTGNKVDIIPTSNIVETIRAIKDKEEIEFIRKACEIADNAIAYCYSQLHAGVTEKQFAWAIERFIKEQNNEPLPFEIIVASGPNSALPHASPSDRLISEGDPIIIDMGARSHGYCSDITRSFFIGKTDERYYQIYNIVLAAQLTGISSITAGMKGQVADGLIRDIIVKAGYEDRFGHGSGHGIGIDTHELPRLGIRSNDTIQNDMVFTIEPGIYIPGWGGIRIEDTVSIEHGKLTSMSHASKEPQIPGG